MPFQKYEAPTKPQKAVPDVKIGALGISVNRSAIEKFGLADASFVNLWFDPSTNKIAITASNADDDSAFKATPRGKNKANVFIPAGKFYSAFNITLDEKNASSTLEETEGMASFALPNGKAAPKPYTGAKRGRKPKSVQA